MTVTHLSLVLSGNLEGLVPLRGRRRGILSVIIANGYVGVSDPRWASIPCDTDQLIILYAFPGGAHPCSLGQDPSCSVLVEGCGWD